MNNRVTRKICGVAAIPKRSEGHHQNYIELETGWLHGKKETGSVQRLIAGSFEYGN